MVRSLLTTNAKLDKCVEHGYLALGLQLAPGVMASRKFEMCPARGDCYKTCLFYSGRGSAPSIRNARVERTRMFQKGLFAGGNMLSVSSEFLRRLDSELELAWLRARRDGLKLAVRLNVFSDVDWVQLLDDNWFKWWHDIQFYDYTKVYERWHRSLHDPAWPKNYDLTFSCSEERAIHSSRELQRQVFAEGIEVKRPARCTIVVREPDPHLWRAALAHRFVDGDAHDLTFLHPHGSILRLAAKGRAGSRNPKRTRFIP
jgi:hypothetical protein